MCARVEVKAWIPKTEDVTRCALPVSGGTRRQHAAPTHVLGAGASHTLWKVAKGWDLVCRVSKQAAFVKLCDAHAHAHGFLKRERG